MDNFIDQCGFTMVNVSNDGNISDTLHIIPEFGRKGKCLNSHLHPEQIIASSIHFSQLSLKKLNSSMQPQA